MDIVVTVPKSEYANNLREREYAKNNRNTVGFRMFSFRPNSGPGDRIYFVRDGTVSYSKEIIAVEQSEETDCIVTGRTWKGKWKVLFAGERDERHLGISCQGFQGIRYRWWGSDIIEFPQYPVGWFERKEQLLRGRKNLKEAKHIPSDREIRRIEQALGFKLYDWQIKYIKNEPCKIPTGRGTGSTTAYCIWFAITNDEPVRAKDLWLYADGYHGVDYERGWFPKFFIDIWTVLHSAGLQVREIDLM